MSKKLIKLTVFLLSCFVIAMQMTVASNTGQLLEGVGTLEAFYAARGDTGYVSYLKRVKKQIQLDRSMGRYKNIQDAIFKETLIDLYIYSFSPAFIDDSVKQHAFATAEKFLSTCDNQLTQQCIELMKAIIQAYMVDDKLLKAYLINERLKQAISSTGIQDTFTYLLTLYNMAKLGVFMYNEKIINKAEQEIETFLPYIPSPKYYPLVGFIYNAIGVGTKTVSTIASLERNIETLKKAERFLLQGKLDKATKKTLSIIYGNIADTYLDLADSAISKQDLNLAKVYWDSAELYIQKSLELANETGNLLTAYYDKYRLAILKLQRGDTIQAFKEMLEIFDDAPKFGLNQKLLMPDVPEQLVYAARGAKEYDVALDLCYALLLYYDSLEIEIINLASSLFQENIRIQEKKEVAIQKAKRYSRKCNINAIITGMLVFLAFSVWAFYIYRKGKRKLQHSEGQ